MTPTHNFDEFGGRLPFDANFQAPDLIGTVEGWRTWNLDSDMPRYGTCPKLHSVTYPYTWAARQESTAECFKCGENVPNESCTCGFYSAKTLEHLQGLGYLDQIADKGNVPIVGQVANWGKVIEGSQGWRAAKSYPVKLYVPFEFWRFVKPLQKGYGVPVALMSTLPKTTPEQ